MKLVGETVFDPAGNRLPFSPAVIAGNLVFLSGQVPLRDGKVLGADIATQTDCVFENLAAQLALTGCTLGNVVKTTVWLTRQSDFAAFNLRYAWHFDGHRPARSTVVSALALPGALVEIEVIAERE